MQVSDKLETTRVSVVHLRQIAVVHAIRALLRQESRRKPRTA